MIAVTNNDFRKMFELKSSLSKMFRIYIGIPNGFYSLNLADPNDYTCMLKLIELSKEFSLQRRSRNLGDTSQLGDYGGFRNVVYNGFATPLTTFWLQNVPKTGKIEFDFILMQESSNSNKPLSNQRFIRLMSSLGLMKESDAAKVFNNLNLTNEEAKVTASGSGYYIHLLLS